MSPDLLPSIPVIRRITQSLAMLDAILCPEWEYRYYSFNSKWAADAEMASMRDGSGNDWFLLLDEAGAAIKGFAHELANDASVSKNIQTQVPQDFSSFLKEPAFSMQHATFCYWRKSTDSQWNKVSSSLVEDGSSEMLDTLVSGSLDYKEWAEECFEMTLPFETIEAVFSHLPLTKEMTLALNPDSNWESIYADAQEIGYPCVAI
jgi:hypothetical protein